MANLLSDDSLDAVYELAEDSSTLGQVTKEALHVIETVLDEYGNERVAISFNGGKDCTVLLHLLVAARSRRDRRQTNIKEGRHPNVNGYVHVQGNKPPPVPLKSVYITCASPFDAVEEFVSETRSIYNLDLFRTSPGGLPMKEALEIYQRVDPDVKAILVGTRRDDPHGSKLDFKKQTDPGWPPFLRVHPILNWKYEQIWEYLRRFNVPYCSLYDQGYTSLGSTHNTYRNSALRDPSGNYKPAYELHDGSKERCGRSAVDPALASTPL